MIRPIPDEPSTGFKPLPAPDIKPLPAPSETPRTETPREDSPFETPIPVKTATAPKPSETKAAEPEWFLPVPVVADDPTPKPVTPSDNLGSADELRSADEVAPRSDVPAPATQKKTNPPAPEKTAPPYEENGNFKTPLGVPDAAHGTRRPLTAQIPAGPPRKTTQVRRIGEIAPLDDFDHDTEIKKYAAERAQEFNVRFGGEQYAERSFPEMALPWVAPESKYYPLYFHDPALERYGHSHHPLLQPVVSSARFTTQIVMLPYQMSITPPWEMHSPLGWYRPGDVVPKLRYPFPWNAKAAAVEAATVTGIIFAIP